MADYTITVRDLGSAMFSDALTFADYVVDIADQIHDDPGVEWLDDAAKGPLKTLLVAVVSYAHGKMDEVQIVAED